MGPSSKACFLIITIQLLSIVAAQEAEKRVPHGFLGVRGKKTPNDVDSLARLMYTGQDIPFFEEEYSKRAPMGFIGMRGKKLSDDTEYVPKRDGSLIGQIDYNSREDISNEADYPVVDKLLDLYLSKLKESTVESNEVEKRAANIHQFYGVRGKKYDKRPYDVSFRGKFIGVRGKKDGKTNGAKEIKFLMNANEPWAKRKGQMGFFGMRGKKWVYEANSESEQTN